LFVNPSRPINPAILFILALSLALSLHGLAADSFWGDEILAAMFADQPPAKLIELAQNDIHPPLYYLLAGAFSRLTIPLGQTTEPTAASDWLWRFPSVMAIVLTVVVTYKFTIYDLRFTIFPPGVARLTAISAALLLAVSPIVIKYGQEARMHALFMLFSVLSTLLFFRAMAQPQRWTRWLAFALVTAANLYIMYFGFLILAAQTGYFLFTIFDLRFTKKSPLANLQSLIVGFTASVALACLFYLPWWPALFNILRQRATVGAIEGGVGSPLAFVPGVIRALGPLPAPAAWLFLGLFIAGVILLARRNWPLAGFVLLWLSLPLLLPIFLGDPRALQFRYAFVLPVYLIVISYAVVALTSFNVRTLKRSNVPTFQRSNVLTFAVWILATLSFLATLDIYHQTKPDWRGAAAYLDAHTTPNDIILFGPLWDEGRFIDYYYRGQAQLLTPAGLVTNIDERAEGLRATGGRVWAVNRFAPVESPVIKNVVFPGVVISEPTLTVYEPAPLTAAALDLARQAIEAAYPWAAEAEAGGVLNPDPRTAKAGALRAYGDALVAAGQLEAAIEPYQMAVEIFPGWVNGYIILAETYEAVGNLAGAAQAYRQAVAYNLKWRGPQADEAAGLVEAGRWAEAVTAYHKVIEVK
jgi:tetratricopeptide (TPR) repeat protein